MEYEVKINTGNSSVRIISDWAIFLLKTKQKAPQIAVQFDTHFTTQF